MHMHPQSRAQQQTHLIACCRFKSLKPYNLSFQQVLLAYLVPLNQASSSYHLFLPATIKSSNLRPAIST